MIIKGGGLMRIESPITLDDGRVIASNGVCQSFSGASGHDARGRRITNIVGHDGTHYLKVCPNCRKIKPEVAFGYDGRDTGEPERRDQSWCTKCRGLYNTR
jgi:hypothetical protein